MNDEFKNRYTKEYQQQIILEHRKNFSEDEFDIRSIDWQTEYSVLTDVPKFTNEYLEQRAKEQEVKKVNDNDKSGEQSIEEYEAEIKRHFESYYIEYLKKELNKEPEERNNKK